MSFIAPRCKGDVRICSANVRRVSQLANMWNAVANRERPWFMCDTRSVVRVARPHASSGEPSRSRSTLARTGVTKPVPIEIATRCCRHMSADVCPWNVSSASELREPAFVAQGLDSRDVRALAAVVPGNVGTVDDVPMLEAALQHDEPLVRAPEDPQERRYARGHRLAVSGSTCPTTLSVHQRRRRLRQCAHRDDHSDEQHVPGRESCGVCRRVVLPQSISVVAGQ